MRKCVIYARYSSDKQTEQSIEGQLKVCYEYAHKNDLIVLKEYIDRAMTGTNDNRKDFQKMLSDSEKTNEWDICLVYALDRFGRNAIEQGINKYRLQKTGKIVISATQRTSRNVDGSKNLDGIILENVYVGMAEYYSAELSQKVKRGREVSQNKGNFTGGQVVFGYKSVGNKANGFKLVPIEEQAQIIKDVFNEYAGGKQLPEILDELNARGITHHNKPFTKSTLYNMLKNEKYIGITIIKNKKYYNIYPKIVSENIFEIVRAKFAQNQFGKHSKDPYLLRFKVTCGYCGKPVSSDTGTARNGDIVRYYKCIGRKIYHKCDNTPIKKELLENLVINAVTEILTAPDTIDYLAEEIMQEHLKRVEEQSLIKYLESELSQTEKAISNLIACMEQGIITDSTKRRLEELELRKDELAHQIIAEKVKNRINVTKNGIKDYMTQALTKVPQLMINLLVKNIVLYKDKIEITLNYTDSKRPNGDDSRKVFSFYTYNSEIYINTSKKQNYEVEFLI